MLKLADEIDALLRSGKRPSITLYPGTQVWIPKGRAGRPRVRDEVMLFKHYADPRSGKRRARCLGPRCHKRLGVRQRGVCSEACADAAINQAFVVLWLAGATRDDVLEFMKRFETPTKLPKAPEYRPPPSAARLAQARKAMLEMYRE